MRNVLTMFDSNRLTVNGFEYVLQPALQGEVAITIGNEEFIFAKEEDLDQFALDIMDDIGSDIEVMMADGTHQPLTISLSVIGDPIIEMDPIQELSF